VNDAMKAEHQQIEKMLEGLSPSRVPDGLIERIGSEAAAGRFGSEESGETAKVVPFPGDGRRVTRMPAPQHNWTWVAAAAVAVLGAVIAWVIPDRKDIQPVVSTERSTFSPNATRSGVKEVRDGGVVWKAGRPLRRVVVVYGDQMTLRNDRGEQVDVEVPRTEHILVPERVD
jgi:hypothetical protein